MARGAWLSRARAERSEAAGARRGSNLYRALMQETFGAGGDSRRPGSLAVLCVFSSQRRPLYVPSPSRGWQTGPNHGRPRPPAGL